VAYRTSGRTVAESTHAAKEASINFNKKGTATPVLGSLWIFSNASIQAGINTLSMFRHHPKTAALVSLAHIIKGYMNYQVTAWIIAMLPGGDDDKERMLRNLNNWRKYTNIFALVGDQFALLPMSQTWRPFHALGVIAAQIQDGSLTLNKGIRQAVSMFSNSLNPFDAGSFINEDGTVNLAELFPSAISPFMEIWSSGRDFMGRALQKDMYAPGLNEATLNLHRKTKWSDKSGVFTRVARVMAKIGGFNPDNPSIYQTDENGMLKEFSGLNRLFFDVNPTHLEHVVKYYTGGVGKLAIDFLGNIIDVSRHVLDNRHEMPGWNEIVVANRFVNKPHSMAYDRSAFYDNERLLKGLGEAWKYDEKHDKEKYRAYRRSEGFKSVERLKKTFEHVKSNSSKTGVKDIDDKIKELAALMSSKTITPERRRGLGERIERLEKRRDEKMVKMNKEVERVLRELD
jgi:hypothetical protein